MIANNSFTTGNKKFDEKVQKALEKEKYITVAIPIDKVVKVSGFKIDKKFIEKKSKYGNKKTIIDGITFDSKKEADRYAELKLLVKAKKITNLQLQPDFLLQLSYTDYAGRKHNAIHYIADFMYNIKDQTIVEDVKGMQTPVYKLKKKLLLFKYTQIVFNEI